MTDTGSAPAVSVVVRSKDEAPRLRLALSSLAGQTIPVEVVVVDDGSSDETASVIAAASRAMNLTSRRHPTAQGRSAASNAGVEMASGDIVLFMDGDILAAPDMAERHLAEHVRSRGAVVRGETWHLRQTRFFRDPEIGDPMPGEERRVTAMPEAECVRLRVTRAQIEQDFCAITTRGQPGIYPGAGPRRLYELEMAALSADEACPTIWAAASGHNLSVQRSALRSVGGLDPGMTHNEHRRLALALAEAGLPLRLARGARSYHMTHQRGWRDPLLHTGWLETFYARYPYPAVALLPVLWGSLSETPDIPPEARLTSLAALAAAAARLEGVVGLEAVRRAHLRACAAETAA